MRRRTARTAVILLVALMVLATPACRKPFSPQAISADLVRRMSETRSNGARTCPMRVSVPGDERLLAIVVNDAKPAPNPVAAPQELWAELTARSSSGKVLHRLDLGRPM